MFDRTKIDRTKILNNLSPKIAVQFARRAIFRSMKTFTDEFLLTATAQVENLLNSRPLTYVSDDSTAQERITPNPLL